MASQGPGPSELSELSSIASSLDQIARRVTALADAAVAAKRDDLGADLIAVERALTGAVRRLRASARQQALAKSALARTRRRRPVGAVGERIGRRIPGPLHGTWWREPVPQGEVSVPMPEIDPMSRTCHLAHREVMHLSELSPQGAQIGKLADLTTGAAGDTDPATVQDEPHADGTPIARGEQGAEVLLDPYCLGRLT